MSAERQNEFLEFVKIIDGMSEDEIIALEKERNQEAHLTKEDCVFLAADGYWKLEEACGFLLNIDRRRTMIMDLTSSGYTRTFGARYFQIFKAYARCLDIGEVSSKTIPNQIAFEHGDKRYEEVVVPKDFLLWAKSKGLPIPPMLWSAVFTPEEFPSAVFNNEISKQLPLSKVNDYQVVSAENEPFDEAVILQNEDTESSVKDPVRVADGKMTGHKIRKFKDKIRRYIEDDKKIRNCDCNHLKYQKVLKATWASLERQLFGEDAKLKKVFALRKEPSDYLLEICRETFSDMSLKVDEKEKFKWKVVKSLAKKTSRCPIAHHNEI